jgi:dolichol-phosphate mannosyltransferase
MTDFIESPSLPEDASPCRGSSLPQYGERIVATAMAVLADALFFLAATSSGLRIGTAHILSFIFATAISYSLNIRVAIALAGRGRDLRLYVYLLATGLLALLMRGGVLAIFINGLNWPPSMAIFVAIGAGMAVTLPGYAYCLSAPPVWKLGAGPQWRGLAVGLVVYAFVLRLVYLGQTELLPEETYYWNYSRHLDIGYLDHPPMVAWLIRLGTASLGTSQFGVRISALFCAAATAFFSYRLTRNLFNAPTALVAMALSQVLPFFFAAGFVMTPDTPLVAAWAAELYFLERALVAGHSRAWWGAGICMGMGLLSKYTIGLLAPAALLFILLDPRARQSLRRWNLYAAAVIALVIFSPVIFWNAHNEWASFGFQTARRLAGKPQFALYKLIGDALALITPTGVIAAAVALFGRRKLGAALAGRAEARRKWRFMQIAVLVPLAVFAAVSLRHNVKFDWTAELWLAALPAIAFAITSSGESLAHGLGGKIDAAWTPTLVAVLVMCAAGLHFLVLGLPGLGYSEQMDVIPVGWRDLGRQVNQISEELREVSGTEPVIVGMDRYSIASEIAFYTAADAGLALETTSAHLFGWTGLMYERWMPIDSQAGRTLLLVSWKPDDLTNACVASHAERLGPMNVGVVKRDNVLVRRYYYRTMYGYRRSAPCL